MGRQLGNNGIRTNRRKGVKEPEPRLIRCKSWDLIHRTLSDFAIHPLAPGKPVLRILDRIDPLAKLAAMR
jgi:hypothetical protein